MVNMPNKDLVEKGRTMSIDQAVQRGMIRERFYYSLGHPRTMSVDSIDYTSMFYGEIDEEVAAKIRKDRKEKKHGSKL